MKPDLFTNSEVLSNSGRFLLREEAINYLQAFFTAEEPSVLADVKQTIVSGQVIGLNQLKEFVQNIESHNSKSEKEEQIIAVRIYSSLSERAIFPGKMLKDVILEPVVEGGRDYHNLFQEVGLVPDGLMLGSALPCPNLCPLAFNCEDETIDTQENTLK